MAFKDFPDQEQGVGLLQRSLERGRLAHAYLFTGHELSELEAIAQTLAKTLNCQQPVRSRDGVAIDSCDQCANCRKIANGNHADVHWVRPESKSRTVSVSQMRDLMHDINLKPTEAEYKVAIIVAADRLNVQGANAFLKTLEEPPPRSVLILLTTEQQRLLETIISRCLRLNFAGDGPRPLATADMEWLANFSDMASAEEKSLISRYRLMDVLLQKLNAMKTSIDENLTAKSPLQKYDDVEKDLRDKWEDELTASIEAEYRRQRTDLLAILQRWLRDVWLMSIGTRNTKHETRNTDLLNFPDLIGTKKVASRITAQDAVENLQIIEGTQRLLHTNVQEALALEVGLLKLHL
jgi:DNA polymerase-3 subunit delta'